MAPKRFIKKLAKYVYKLMPKCLRRSPSHAIGNGGDETDAMGNNCGADGDALEFTEAQLMDHMDKHEIKKVANSTEINNNLILKEVPCHSFDLICMPEVYQCPRKNRFFAQMMSKFTRVPLDKLVIMKSFNHDDEKDLIGLSFANNFAIMIVYADHPLIKHIASSLIKTSKQVEFRWLNLREIQILKNY